jgi:hypothetical protein
MMVSVASRKASPGVTTLAALLCAYWDASRSRLLLEADPDGGALAARWSDSHGLTWDPGLLALSTDRRPLSSETLPEVAQPVADGVWVSAAPPGAEQVAGALSRLGSAGVAELAASDNMIVADCGRLRPDSAALPVAAGSALTMLVVRGRLDEVHALVPAVDELTAAGCRLGLVVIEAGPYRPVEVASSLGLELVGSLPCDERAAATFNRHGLTAGRRFTRSLLAAAAMRLVSSVANAVETQPGPKRDVGPRRGARRGADHESTSSARVVR